MQGRRHMLCIEKHQSGHGATMPYPRDAEAVIGDWRKLLRHIENAETGSVDRRGLMVEVQRLQDEYFALRENAFRLGRDLPPLPPE